MICYVLSQEIPFTEPMETTVRDEDWGTVGVLTSPPPAVEVAMPIEA
jgi:hypothetical protein